MLSFMNSQNVMQFESGERIFREGERGDLMYILIRGAVDLKMNLESMKLWINNHIGVPLDEIEAAMPETGPRPFHRRRNYGILFTLWHTKICRTSWPPSRRRVSSGA